MPFRSHRSGLLRSGSSSVDFFGGIRFRLALLVLSLVAVTAFSVSFVVMQIMDSVLMDSMVERGSAITEAVSVPAGYSLLKNDRLAMDNLVAQVKRSQPELEYVAILDLEQNILAHNRLDQVGGKFTLMPGERLRSPADLSIARGLTNDLESYEFVRPIYFADQHVGNVALNIGGRPLMEAKTSARRQVYAIAVLMTACSLLGAMVISSIFTRPIEDLADGVARLQRDEQVEDVPVRTRNELGVLTRNFNQMAQTIQKQKSSLQDYAKDLESSYNDMVRILAAALDARDNYTYGHSARVAQFAMGVARKLDYSESELKELELACLLHDIGKIHVPDSVLNKRDKLSQEEYREISKHPVLGSQILELTPSLCKYIPAVKHHHERYDGTGYPGQLKGDAVPLNAQILALADTYDAMTSSRPYRQGLSKEQAVAEISRCSGSQFNPKLVDLFVEVVPSLPEMSNDSQSPFEALCVS